MTYENTFQFTTNTTMYGYGTCSGIIEIIDALKKLQKKKINLSTLILGSPDPKNFSSISVEKLNYWNESKIIIWKPKVADVLPYLQKSRIAILPLSLIHI